ncbi:hypothetical protein RAK27_08615 [Carnobacterium maltaromaticum]|uniref:Phage protein n=1 Tax=Carnobacterium maltaromaticum TaxID=2751 RepID=A0AAW9K8W0_CARML|nr:hypothetical protein [Carnobacterium maltaromaticum]MDZ5758713.1 hypothetical protein [Carnobacterium maltaromaticum]
MNKNKHKWLKEYQSICEEIEYLEYKLIKTERELKRWESGDLSKLKLEKDSNASQLESIVKTTRHELEYKIEEKEELIILVSKFKGLNNQILRMKYIEDKNLYEIALDLNFSVGYIQQRHAELKRMLGVLDEMDL